jgi:uncharacterized protein (DUF1697 family)
MKPPSTREMLTIISMLRAINVGGHSPIKMDALRALYQSLELKDPQTYVQSGNVVFQAQERKLVRLAEQIQNAIEKQFGFRPGVVLRTSLDLRDVVARNPFAKRREIEPGKLGVVFFNESPASEACDAVLKAKTEEEVRVIGREFYIYFPNGMGQSKLFAAIAGKLKSGTTRNWNTVTKLLEMAERLEPSR